MAADVTVFSIICVAYICISLPLITAAVLLIIKQRLRFTHARFYTSDRQHKGSYSVETCLFQPVG
jgi:hypothetical protein